MLRKFHVKINEKEYDVELEEFGVTGQAVITDVALPEATQAAPAVSATPGEGETLTAPMPGNILNILVSVGQEVKQNQTVAILEAMKMENEIVAPKDGIITAILATKGATIDVGQPIITIK